MNVISMGRYKASFFSPGSDRVAIILRYTNCFFNDAGVDQFRPRPTDPSPWCSRSGIDSWPFGIVESELAVIIPDREFSGYAEMEEYTRNTGLRPLLLPWLVTVCCYADFLSSMGIRYVYATDPNSLRYSKNERCLKVPYYHTHDKGGIGSDLIDDSFDEEDLPRICILVGCD